MHIGYFLYVIILYNRNIVDIIYALRTNGICCYYLQNFFFLMLGPFVFFNIQKTKYLQLLTSAMRWLAFTIMIVYAIRKLAINGPQGNPPLANISGKQYYRKYI